PPPSFTPFPYTTLFRSDDLKHVWRRRRLGACDDGRLTDRRGRHGGLRQLRREQRARADDAGGVRSRRIIAFAPPHQVRSSLASRSEEHTSELQSRSDLV